MDTEVSHPLLYPEKRALKGHVPLITCTLTGEAELGCLIRTLKIVFALAWVQIFFIQ